MWFITFFWFRDRSVLSRYNGTSTDCAGSGVGSSSFRCNNSHWPDAYYPATATHHPHYPPQYNHQFTNGTTANQHRSCHNTSNGSALPPHGRLQKSLSFAFQTPAMMNEVSRGSCQTQPNTINYPERSLSRSVSEMIGIQLNLLVQFLC